MGALLYSASGAALQTNLESHCTQLSTGALPWPWGSCQAGAGSTALISRGCFTVRAGLSEGSVQAPHGFCHSAGHTFRTLCLRSHSCGAHPSKSCWARRWPGLCTPASPALRHIYGSTNVHSMGTSGRPWGTRKPQDSQLPYLQIGDADTHKVFCSFCYVLWAAAVLPPQFRTSVGNPATLSPTLPAGPILKSCPATNLNNQRQGRPTVTEASLWLPQGCQSLLLWGHLRVRGCQGHRPAGSLRCCLPAHGGHLSSPECAPLARGHQRLPLRKSSPFRPDRSTQPSTRGSPSRLCREIFAPLLQA